MPKLKTMNGVASAIVRDVGSRGPLATRLLIGLVMAPGIALKYTFEVGAYVVPLIFGAK
jgi:hypothetical protein